MIENLLNDAVRANFVEKVSYAARMLPSMAVIDNADFVSADCGLPSDTFNVVVARNLLDPTKLLQDAVAPFMAKQFPMALWYWEDVSDLDGMSGLTAFGLAHSETHVAMAAELAQLQVRLTMPTGLTIHKVAQAEELLAYGAVIAELFGELDEGKQVMAYHRLLSEYGISRLPAFHYYLGLYGDEVVAIGSLFMGSATAGIYDIVTKAEHRHKGIGSAMFAYLVQVAQQSPRRYAVLQASPDGLSIYEKAGFSAVGRVHTFENRHMF